VRDPASSIVSTFGVWLLSERLGFSPIITVVIYAMTLAQAAPGRLGARLRISSYSVWETAVFVVNVLAFVLMGLHARMIIEPLSPEQRWGSLVFGLSVIVVRIAWLAVYTAIVATIRQWRRGLRLTGGPQGIDGAPSLWAGAACVALSRWRLLLHYRSNLLGAT
jgi:monovalent cation/hydrogen antiporter